jgi:hypothetical protein
VGVAGLGHQCGLAGRSAFAPAAFDTRQWRRQVAAARGALAAPGLVPLATSSDTVPVGPVIRAVGRRWTPVLAVPAASFTRHVLIVGASQPNHPAIIDRATWQAAQSAGAEHGTSRDIDETTPVPATGRIRCRDCKRRMAGNAKGRRQFIYYRCPHDPAQVSGRG